MFAVKVAFPMVITLLAPSVGTEDETIEVLLPTISLMVKEGPLGVSVWKPVMYAEAEFLR